MSSNPALSLESCVTVELASLFRLSACSLFKVFKKGVNETEALKCHAKGLVHGRCPLPTPILLKSFTWTLGHWSPYKLTLLSLPTE